VCGGRVWGEPRERLGGGWGVWGDPPERLGGGTMGRGPHTGEMRSEAAHRVGRRDVHAVWDGRLLGMGKVVAHAREVVESGVAKFSEPSMGNKRREEGFPIQQFFKVVIVRPEELLADVWWGSTGADRRNGSETTGCRPSGMGSLPICEPFQGCDVRMMPVGSEISETCGCTPCRSIVVVDATAIPSVSDGVEGLVGGLG
jgi:hypothetical protein